MKINGKCFIYSVLLFSVLLIAGCGNDLSRGKAEEMIKKEMPPIYKPCCQVERNNQKLYTFACNAMERGVNASDVLKLQEQGLLTIRETAGNLFTGNIHYFDLTDKGKPFTQLVDKEDGSKEKFTAVILAKVDSVEVTGITKPSKASDGTACAVEYTVRFTPTPFGEVLLNANESMEGKFRATFTLYDNGWKPTANKVLQEPRGSKRGKK